VKRVCTAANVVHPQRITTTKMRHRISTLYAAVDIPLQDRELFYKHMGHFLHMNQNVYQVPLAVAEINSLGSRLAQLDGDTRQASRTCNDEASSISESTNVSDNVRADNDQSVSVNNILRPQSDDEARAPPDEARAPPRKRLKLLQNESRGTTAVIYYITVL